MIAIVDYNMGNPASISNMLKKLGHDSEITADADKIAAADRIILPGVGAFDAGMDSLERTALIPVLEERVLVARVPVLGICLGMQLMSERSEEGQRDGLGWMVAEALRFRASRALKIPHMGWNLVEPTRVAALITDLPPEPRFYFVHSYFIQCGRPKDVLLTTVYGERFHSAFHRDNLWGVQFHPEKSHKFGMRLLRNFAEHC